MSLVETVIVSGLIGLVVLVLFQTASNVSVQIQQINTSLVLQQVESKIRGAFSEVTGTEVFWRLKPGAQELSWSLPVNPYWIERPFFNRGSLYCDSLINPTSNAAAQIPVDIVLAGGENPVLRGLPLKDAPSVVVSNLYLTLIGQQWGVCPAIDSCRNEGSCLFQLIVKLRRKMSDGTTLAFKDLSFNLSCRTWARPNFPSDEEIGQCKIMGAPTPSPSTLPAVCAGDVNQDGRTDELDLKYLEAFSGQVPRDSAVPNLGLAWTALGGDETPTTLRWEAMGSWINPTPTPSYQTAYLEAIKNAYQIADISPDNDDYVDGADLGLVAENLGCVAAESPVCFEDTVIYPLFERLAGAASPAATLDFNDVSFLHYCSFPGQENNPVCLGLNLDGQCSYRRNYVPQATDNYCRSDLPQSGESQGSQEEALGFVVIGSRDIKIAEYLLTLTGSISRYRETKPGSQLTPCLIRGGN